MSLLASVQPGKEPAARTPELQSMLSTAELDGRPSHPPDYEAENRALIALARELAISPDNILQKLADTALSLCRAHSAGLSLLEDGDQRQNFHWRAIAGRWAEHIGGGTPRDFGPCGTVLDHNIALLCSHPERDFPYFADVTPGVEEALLIPFYVRGEAVGTIWVVAHDTTRRFDREDLRIMTNLGAFAAAAYQSTIIRNELTIELDDTRRLQEISTRLIHESRADALYQHVVDAAIELLRSDMASMQRLHDAKLWLLASRGFAPATVEAFEWVCTDTGTACAAALRSGRRVVVPDIETCNFIVGTAAHEVHCKSGIRAVQSTPPISRSGRLLGMISNHWREPHKPTERELLRLDVLARQASDLIERTQADEASQRIAAIVDSSDDAIVSKDLNGIIKSWNKGAERIFGYTREEAVGKPITILIPPERHDEEPAILERIRRGERIEHYETVRMRKHGRRIDISLTVSPVRNATGKIIGASKIARDITERKRSEAQIRVLAREAEHRAKNVLATVQATVHLSHADTPDGLKEAIEGRIQALANVHRLFVETRWTGANLHGLAKDELAAYWQGGARRVQLDGPDILLEPSAAQAIAVSLHELATDAAKYGALSVADGHVEVAWSRTADGIVLRWTETGGPPAKPPTRKGFGTRVMDGMIRGQMKGDMRFEWRAEGLACEIAIPVPATESLR
jgi:PAS domain S-box-containing protein